MAVPHRLCSKHARRRSGIVLHVQPRPIHPPSGASCPAGFLRRRHRHTVTRSYVTGQDHFASSHGAPPCVALSCVRFDEARTFPVLARVPPGVTPRRVAALRATPPLRVGAALSSTSKTSTRPTGPANNASPRLTAPRVPSATSPAGTHVGLHHAPKPLRGPRACTLHNQTRLHV